MQHGSGCRQHIARNAYYGEQVTVTGFTENEQSKAKYVCVSINEMPNVIRMILDEEVAASFEAVAALKFGLMIS